MVTIASLTDPDYARQIAEMILRAEMPVDLIQHRKGDDVVVSLLTEEEDEDSVLAMLVENGAPRAGVIPCPSCRGVAVEFPGRPRRSPSAAVVEKIAEKLHIREPGFYCRSCHHTWS